VRIELMMIMGCCTVVQVILIVHCCAWCLYQAHTRQNVCMMP